MSKKIFVNLPVKDLEKSIGFFTELGFSFNPQFTDEKATCMIIEDGHIFAMLITENFFKTFTKKPISDAKKNTEVLLALQLESKEEVDKLVKNAVNAGGDIYMEPVDHGWMYQHSFADLDGHQWELFCMDEKSAPSQPDG
ncbi:VOC family protein [Echinicola jeungdonensis]|uniref:VOC family protein n=1 Tax=Echinicola jeungdonensis TaxID=709343 RepID=A0ABV5J6M1_9BACT